MSKRPLSEQEIMRYSLLKAQCENSFMFFCMYMFKEANNIKYIPYRHLLMIAQKLEAVARGDIKRLIINIFPRSGKTEQAVKMFIPWGLALNPRAKFIHLSYSSDLAMDNSAKAKEYISMDAYQYIWEMQLKQDTKSKQKWFNKQEGGCYATSTGGQITGFGAGLSAPRQENENPFKEFSGAIIIDDPNKPSDAFSDAERTKVNERYNNTIRSRVNNPRETPIIVIQQRIHEDDLSGFLLGGGSGEEWEHLNLPALDENNEPLCPEKFTFEELMTIKEANPVVFNGQYMQNPMPMDGGIFTLEWFQKIKKSELPQIDSWQMYIDGAYTKNTANDPTGIIVCAKHNNNLYILSAVSKYMTFPELLTYIPTYIHSLGVHINMVYIEPKATGISINQVIKEQTSLNVSTLKGKILRESKMERASKAAPYVQSERVFLLDANWNEDFLYQVCAFPNAKHDEYVDLLSYAIDKELYKRGTRRIIW